MSTGTRKRYVTAAAELAMVQPLPGFDARAALLATKFNLPVFAAGGGLVPVQALSNFGDAPPAGVVPHIDSLSLRRVLDVENVRASLPAPASPLVPLRSASASASSVGARTSPPNRSLSAHARTFASAVPPSPPPRPLLALQPLRNATNVASASFSSADGGSAAKSSGGGKRRVFLRVDTRDVREWRSQVKELVRAPSAELRPHRARLFALLGGACPYTLAALPVSTSAQEIEHTFECQAMAHAVLHAPAVFDGLRRDGVLAWGASWARQSVHARALLAGARAAQNGSPNLSLTTHAVNVQKEGAFLAAINDLEADGVLERPLVALLAQNFTGGAAQLDERSAREAAARVVSAVRDAEEHLVRALLAGDGDEEKDDNVPTPADAADSLAKVAAAMRARADLADSISQVIGALL